ncbi:hypothetical protein ACIF6K_11280 [Streptomyces sp. NPDC085942]|uniref:hypothetical protein n=1 Tax=Streptomyces sp. NPDC085942 TaxID=3365743 RepID=UPI0037D6F55C
MLPATRAAALGLIARAAGTTSASGQGCGGAGGRIVRTEHRGTVRTLAFDASTRQVRTPDGVFLHGVERGRPRLPGPCGEAGLQGPVREGPGGSGPGGHRR